MLVMETRLNGLFAKSSIGPILGRGSWQLLWVMDHLFNGSYGSRIIANDPLSGLLIISYSTFVNIQSPIFRPFANKNKQVMYKSSS